jgi:hypothetical protein
MTSITKIIGWLVLLITEVFISIAFFSTTDRVALIGYQVGIFFTVWASVAGKNIIDLKRDQIPGYNDTMSGVEK